MGVSNAWADDKCGFWGNGAASITITVDGTDKTPSDLNSNGVYDFELGTVTTSLTIKSAWAKVWGQNQISSIKLYYRIKGEDASSSATYSSVDIYYDNNFNTNDQYWHNTSINKTISINLAPGNYEIEYYFMADAKNEDDKYLSNGSGNYHANFTIPSKKLSVAAFPNSNTVSGNKTGITVGTEYPITATPASGYKFNKWTATNGAASVTITNASSASTKVTFKNYSNDATITAEFVTTSSKTVYLKPTGYWNTASPRFVAHIWNNSSAKDIVMEAIGCASTPDYYTCEIPAGYHSMLFFREKSDGSEQWNKTADLIIPTNNNTCYTISSTGDGMNTAAAGSWGTYTAPTYTVTLVADSHGTYNVKSGNTTKTSKLSGNVTMNVALNSKITITTNTPQPGYDQSQGAAITIGKNDKQKATLGAEYTICGPTTITGNFVSTEEQVVYLQPTGHWNGNNAQYKAFVFHDTGSKWMKSLMTNVTCETDDQACYTCTLPAGYNSVIFCRVKDNTVNSFSSGNLWNQTNDLAIPVKSENNCYKITSIGSLGEKSSGNWKTFTTPTYDVTIKPTIHGTYSVVCNGRTYLAPNKEEIVIPNVPVGTTLTIQDVTPNNETEYTSDIIYKESANAEYQKLEGNQITVCGNTTIDENFVTRNAHVVYLRIPSGLEWGTGNSQKLSVYNKLTGNYTPTPMTEANGTYEPGYKYYTYTIPVGTHTIRFEYNNQYQTHDFPHVMPLGSLNCYTIHSREGDTKVFNGYWSELLSNGDYRLLYVEQVVEKSNVNGNEWKTIVTRKKAHPSDIIPQSIITEGKSKVVSLHIFKDRTYTANAGGGKTYESSNNPEIILQQYNSSTNTWENKERHMVFGPLQTLPGMAMAPGRRNVAANAELVYDDGIEIIKKDDHQVHPGSGVWNFTVKQLAGNQATIDLTSVERYTGEYYIRTDVANGGWFNYNPTNHMTRSDEAKANSNFSHYYCKWVESNNNVNVKFTVANDYGYAISDTLEADRTDLWGVALAAEDKMVTDQKLPKNANVRFAWNEYSNFVHRAYIAGSAVVSDRFLVLEGDANIFDAAGSALNVSGLKANEQIFRDNSNWIYYADVQMKPMAPVKVTAQYNDKTQYFIGKQNETVTLLQGSGSEKYLIRMLYDFKTNQLISAYVPGASDKVNAISTNLMLIRQDDKDATQLEFNNETPHDMETIATDRRAYGVIEFTKKRLINGLNEKDESVTELQKGLYWISFPFDVDLSEVISFGEYGKHWVIEEYDGATRAAEGCWLESESFWIYHWDQNITLEAGKGYVIGLDVDLIRTDNLFELSGDRPIGIYFPSKSPVNQEIVNQTTAQTYVEPHECGIVRNTPKGDRRIADSHWNVVGTPSYVNTIGNYNNFTANIETKPEELKYYYEWLGEYNHYAPVAAESQTFKPLRAYMVQYAGHINWTSIWNVHPAAIAAKQSSDDIKEHRLRLEIQQNGNKADHTFVRLQDEDGVTDHFDFNHDLCKIINAGANIYSFVTTETYPIEVAANVLPIQETIIPIGVVTSAAGEYTFTMPDGTDGIVVELIDYETNTRTNLLLDNYTVNLGKGTFDNRFALHVKPSKVTTSLEDVNTNTTGVKKYLIDGVLYMQKDGVLYDAQGKLVR